MKAKFWIAISGCVLTFSFFHHQVKAEDTQTSTNVFLDEGDTDYEMPKVNEASTESPKETKKTAKKSSKKDVNVQNADDYEDDEKPTASTKGDDYDQIQNPENAAAPAQAQEVKEPLKSKAAVKLELPKKRKIASVESTQGFKTTKDGDCAMYTDADKTSEQILVVKGAKKLWVEQSGDGWFKAFHKKGSGYLPAECFE